LPPEICLAFIESYLRDLGHHFGELPAIEE
jgi:hypothetical protein